MVKTAGTSDSLFPTVTAPVPDSTYLEAAVGEINAQHWPLRQGIIDGVAHEALWQVMIGGFQSDQGSVDALMDRLTLLSTSDGSKLWADAAPPQPGFDFVKVLDLQDNPSCLSRRLFERIVVLASDMRPAASERDLPAAALREGTVRLVSIALQRAAEVHGNDVIQARGRAAGLPVEHDITAGFAGGP